MWFFLCRTRDHGILWNVSTADLLYHRTTPTYSNSPFKLLLQKKTSKSQVQPQPNTRCEVRAGSANICAQSADWSTDNVAVWRRSILQLNPVCSAYIQGAELLQPEGGDCGVWVCQLLCWLVFSVRIRLRSLATFQCLSYKWDSNTKLYEQISHYSVYSMQVIQMIFHED